MRLQNKSDRTRIALSRAHASAKTLRSTVPLIQSTHVQNQIHNRITVISQIVTLTRGMSSPHYRYARGCVVECRICNREVVGSNLSLGYFAPRFTQPSIPPGSVNEYQLRLGRQRQVWLTAHSNCG